MSPSKKLEEFAQDVYSTIKNRRYDDIESDDGQQYIAQIVSATNLFLDELEYEVNVDGAPIDWFWARQNDYELGTATAGASSVPVPKTVDRILAEEQRYVTIRQDGTPVSYWAVVNPSDIGNRNNRITEDMCARVGNSLIFSRVFRDTEANGTVVGDVALATTRLSIDPINIKALDTVKPRQLLVLGVAKNATLPDIVQGKLNPNYVQKYEKLLDNAVARSNVSSMAGTVQRQSFGHVRGLY